MSEIWIFWLRVLIDICVCSLLHAMVAPLQQGCLAKRCKYGRIFCMYTHPDPRANILPCPPIQKGGEWSQLASAHFHIGSRGQCVERGRNAPLPRLATLLVQCNEGEKRVFSIESRSFTLQRPPAVSDGEEHQYRGKHGAILVTHYSISAGLSSCVMGESDNPASSINASFY